MPPFLIISVIYFLFVSFVSSTSGLGEAGPFITYYSIQLKFISNNRGVFLFGFLFIFLIFFVYNILKRKEILQNLLYYLRKFIALFITGSLITFLLLYFIAFIEINILSIVTYTSPKLLGVLTDSQKINEELVDLERPPTIIAGENNRNILPLTIAIASAGKGSFYAAKVVGSFPHFLTFPAKKNTSGVIKVSDSLLITNINSPEFQSISPVVASLMIKKYFPRNIIKSYPKVRLMTEDEYQKFRKEDFENKFKKFDEVINQIQKDRQDLSSGVEEIKNQISENEKEMKDAKTQREKEYTKCVNDGYYKEGVFVKTNSKEYCQEQMTELDQQIIELKKSAEDLNGSLQSSLSQIEQYKVYENYYVNQKSLTKEASTYIAYEFGTFEPPETIKIALTLDNSSKAVADYMELLVHEYLHYTRYDESGLKIGSAFFDEGLTEYFARNIIKQSMSVDTNLGYPVNVKIVSQIAKRVAESDLADAYLANDQPSLENLLDRVYGKDFYKQNALVFETLHYSSDADQILKTGDDIMSEIGGDQLTKEDINTSYSTFQ